MKVFHVEQVMRICHTGLGKPRWLESKSSGVDFRNSWQVVGGYGILFDFSLGLIRSLGSAEVHLAWLYSKRGD